MSDSKLSEFVNVTHASLEEAQQFLARANGDLPLAVSMYLSESAPPSAASSAVASPVASASTSLNPSRAISRIGSTANSQTSMHQAPKRRFATFSDLAAQENEHQRTHAASAGSDPHNLFTGGEKSGLAVTPQQRQPNLVDEILRRAQQNVARPGANFDEDDSDVSGDEDAASGSSRSASRAQKSYSFKGRGSRLGTEEDDASPETGHRAAIESMLGRDDEEEDDEDQEVQQRTLNFWNDGFSVDDGPLYRFDDPANEAYLRAINTGRAPMRLLNVRPRQPVDVKVVQRQTDYVKPAATLQNSGPGQRLGSPSPSDQYHLGLTSTVSRHLAPAVPADQSSRSPAAASAQEPASGLGQEGDASVQIRFADGTTRRAKFDRAGPVQQLYDYIDAVKPADREYYLRLPMPPTKLEDKQQSLESAGAVGAVVVQLWA